MQEIQALRPKTFKVSDISSYLPISPHLLCKKGWRRQATHCTVGTQASKRSKGAQRAQAWDNLLTENSGFSEHNEHATQKLRTISFTDHVQSLRKKKRPEPFPTGSISLEHICCLHSAKHTPPLDAERQLPASIKGWDCATTVKSVRQPNQYLETPAGNYQNISSTQML